MESQLSVSIKEYKLYVDGEWIPSSTNNTFERVNPATGESIARFSKASREDAQKAINAAKRAFDKGEWSSLSGAERGNLLYQASQKILERIDDLAKLLSMENGKPINEAKGEVQGAASIINYYAGLCRAVYGQTAQQIHSDLLGLTLRVPVGVVAIITPWNFPLGTLNQKLPAALAAGCTVVIKPASYTAATTLELAKIFDEVGFPKGVINVLTGSGEELGNEIATNSNINKIAFTGSTDTGKNIMRLSSDSLKKLSMELGGKSPNIIFSDANMEDALDGALFGGFFNQGEVCTSGSRLLIQEDIYDEFLEKLVGRAKLLKIGDPLNEETEMGALISSSHLQTVLSYVQKGISEGARLVTGGNRLSGGDYDRGYYMEPTIFADVTPDMTIAREEIFGPVLSVMKFSDFEEAMAIANDTCFGLAGAVWTKDIDKAIKSAKTIKSGTVWVNHYMEAHSELPFGGVKESGFGKELGLKGLDEFSDTKTVQIHIGARNKVYKW